MGLLRVLRLTFHGVGFSYQPRPTWLRGCSTLHTEAHRLDRSPKAGNDVSASRARGPERGVEEALLGEVPRVREPGCSCSPSGPHSPNRGAELALESRCQGVTRKQKLSPAGPSVYRMQSTTRKGACAPTTVRRRDATAQTPEAASSLLRPS